MNLTLDPHDELDVRVGNALRFALAQFEIAYRKHRPYTTYDEIMEDLYDLDPNGPRWMDER